MIIRPETDDDRNAIARVVGAAFGSDVEPALVERIRASAEYVPELALVAERDGRIDGHVMVSGASLRSADGVHPVAILAPLAVDPACQRDGVGGMLVREVTRRAGDLGYPFVVLEGSPAYYARFGFEPASRYSVRLPLPDRVPPEAAQLLRLPGFSEASLHGGGEVVYPSAFDGIE